MIIARNKKDLNSNHYTSMFTKSIRLPYKHLIKHKLETNQILRLEEFDSSWHLRAFRNQYRRPILPPFIALKTGKYRRTNGSKTSTRRLESGFKRAARETA
jgi:hypothetical protein